MAGELWVEKYAPSCEAELVVHKKKVQEVREWLEGQRASLGQPGVSRLLVVTGGWGMGGVRRTPVPVLRSVEAPAARSLLPAMSSFWLLCAAD